jgi:hypothetical protein
MFIGAPEDDTPMTSIHEHDCTSIDRMLTCAWEECLQKFKTGSLRLPLKRLKWTDENEETHMIHLSLGFASCGMNDDSGFIEEGNETF